MRTNSGFKIPGMLVALPDANWICTRLFGLVVLACLGGYASAQEPDAVGPILTVASHTNGQPVIVASITLSGTATDAGRGDNGISSVTVNGVPASGGTATGAGTANWSRTLTLSIGSNTITVVARDGSPSQNTTSAGLTINYVVLNLPLSTAVNTLILPHLAVGGPFTSFISVMSSDAVPSKQVRILLLDDNGAPLVASVDGTQQSIISFALSPYQERVFRLTSDTVKAGWALIAVAGPGNVDASIRFVTTDAQDVVSDAVGVLPSDKVTAWNILVDTRSSGSSVGVALVNPGSQPIEVSFDFYQGPNAVAGTGTVSRTIPAGGHFARFVSELYPVNFSGVGTLSLSGSAPFSAMALRVDGSQLSALPAHKWTFVWNFATPATGTRVNGGQWTITLFDQGQFSGREDYTVGPLAPASITMRGYFSGDRFVAERAFITADGIKGVELYQGVLSNNGNVITGTFTAVSEAGAVVSTDTFVATLSY